MGKDKKWYRKQDSKELICTTHGHELMGNAGGLEGG